MVNVDQIDKLFNTNFDHTGSYEIDPQGVVHVKGNLEAKEWFDPVLPVQFGVVEGWVKLFDQPHITSLKGCPHRVMGDFFCRAHNMTDLVHAPTYVGGRFRLGSYALRSLEHLPTQGSRTYMLTWTPHLPLLRLCEAVNVTWSYPVQFGGMAHGEKATRILKKYMGQGKKGALACAAELVKAGFKENARW